MKPTAAALMVAALAIAPFAGTLGHDFVNWDDDVYVYANPHLHPTTLSGVGWLLTHFYYFAYIPVTMLSHALDVAGDWPGGQYDAVYTANTLHIMSWAEVQAFFERLPQVLAPQGLLTIYGPFRYNGTHTSDSNATFDTVLRSADPLRGVRDFEAVAALAREAGLTLVEDRAMPANNRCITWRHLH